MKSSAPESFIACRIYLDFGHWDCAAYRTRKENLRGAWKKLEIDNPNFIPKSKEEFERRNGKITWFTSY